jgi:hypothetical protein
MIDAKFKEESTILMQGIKATDDAKYLSLLFLGSSLMMLLLH